MKKQLIALAIGLTISATASASNVWDKGTVYNAGDLVEHNGETYVSTHWNQGNAPEVNDVVWDGWLHIDSDDVGLYQHEVAYLGSSIVNYKGQAYLSKWWVKGEYPNESSAWRLLSNFDLIPKTPTKDPDPNVNPKSPETIYGVDSDNDGIRDSYKLAVVKAYKNPEVVQLALSVSYEYSTLHQLALGEQINMNVEDAASKYNSIIAFEDCAELLLLDGQINETPSALYNNSIYRSLYYRIGKERLFEAMGRDFDALVTPENPCPQSLVAEAE